ncbi:hypothetical protein EZ428_21430 [Pedobacter frigiditerrae]|uniref:Uncharacterized protein n=1 Tax=Pedobacter frigiditerrae TaxID=2530452 RepID=A0A4R0MKT7_9SPHI|nr:hypothetical protein [Pedobacter frigiditerrae]TCC87269.1 hypothetical protein EZ428_21430 [Pedobacter frigiditerrae]
MKTKMINLALILVGLLLSCSKKDKLVEKIETVKEPTETLQEHWPNHDLLVTKVYQDEHVVFYYDDKMDKSIKWPFKTMSDTWAYVKKTYGAFGLDPKLYVVFHKSEVTNPGTPFEDCLTCGGHPAGYKDPSHDYRNFIDCGLAGQDDWKEATGQAIGIPVHEVGHIVCGDSHEVNGSPSDVLWKDSKFMEIFNYDVYKNIGRKDEADKVYAEMQTKVDTFPRANSYWFRDWFYPIYSKYGEGKLLNGYFALLAKEFPKKNGAYTRNLNWGEFLHFWSGAAGTDLKEQFTIAFGWTSEWEAMLKNAKTDFPNVKY